MVALGAILLVVAGLVIRNQVKVSRDRAARAELADQRERLASEPPDRARRRSLFELLQPVALANCEMARFGEPHDGGYLMCDNLLSEVRAGYSYGISGYDQWGCDVATKAAVPVHQYDCFDTTQPVCGAGRTVFHAECVGDRTETLDGRAFDTVSRQLEKNGDAANRVVMKMDVEGAEWPTLMAAPDEVLSRIDQLVVEFHFRRDAGGGWVDDEVDISVVSRLKQFFEIANLHFNNASCMGDLDPFPTWAYEVLFVNKRLAVVDLAAGTVRLPHPLDTPNVPERADCLPAPR
jgi:hypothetical protein